MASVTERLERTLEREAPVWGVDPVPPAHRHLSGFDIAVLWGDLSVGLLVLLTGALLVPALSLPHAQQYTHVHRTFHLVGPEADLDRIARATLRVGLAELTNAFVPSTRGK